MKRERETKHCAYENLTAGVVVFAVEKGRTGARTRGGRRRRRRTRTGINDHLTSMSAISVPRNGVLDATRVCSSSSSSSVARVEHVAERTAT